MAMPQQAKPTEISRSENPFRRVGYIPLHLLEQKPWGKITAGGRALWNPDSEGEKERLTAEKERRIKASQEIGNRKKSKSRNRRRYR